MGLELEFLVNDKATPEIKKLQAQLKQLKPQITDTEKGFAGINKSLVGLAAGYISFQAVVNSSRAFINMADQAKLLDSQLKLVTDSSIELERVQKSLFDISQESRQSLESTTNLYARMARATEDLGTSEKDLLKATETVNKAMIVSGASTQEASSAITQLSQGLASGVLRGEEFNSITENGSRIARALADSLGVTIGQLRSMSQEGKLTSDVVMEALIGQAKDIDKEFAKMGTTVGQSMTNVSNSMMVAVSELDEVIGATDGLAEAIQDFSGLIDDNIDSIKHFGIFTFSTIDRMIDGFDLLQESAELGVESLIAVPQIGLQSFIAVIYEQIFDLQEMANKASSALGRGNFFSEDELTNTLVSANIALDKSSQIVSSLKVESKEVTDSFNDWNITVDERVANSYKELELLKQQGDEIKSNNELASSRPASLEEQQADFDSQYEAAEALAAYNEEVQNTYDKYVAIIGTEYDQWLIETNNALTELAETGSLTAEELQKVYDTLSQERDTGIALETADETLSGMESMLDMQIQLAESGMNWSESFSGVTGEIANIGKAYKKIDVDKLKYEKADIKLQKDYAKSWLKATGDIEKQKEIEAQFDEDQSKINKTRQSAEIAGYGALAGAMSQAFAEGSTAAKAFQGIQATLGIVNGFTAIAGAWASAPFPANIPAVVATSAQMIPLIGQLTSLGGSGGSGGGGGTTAAPAIPRNEDYYDNALEVAEETNKPILAKFDRQIELLEAISGYGGTAIGLELEKALAEYKAESTIAIIEASSEGGRTAYHGKSSSYSYGMRSTMYSVERNFDSMIGEFAENIDSWTQIWETGTAYWNYRAGVAIDETSFSGASEFIDMLEYMKNNNLLETFGYTQLEYENIISDFQDISTELAVTVLENINTLIDYSNELETLFDEITNTTTYETQNLQKAYEDVSLLAGNQSLADYLQGQIEAITTLEDSLTKSQISLLLSSDVDDYIAQQELIQSIQSSTLETLDSGVLEALNYKDSIMLVADAMAESAKELAKFEETMLGMIENIDDTITSIRTSGMTQVELTQDEIKRLNYTQRAFEVALADSDTESAEDLLSEITSLSSSISRSAFGDVTDLNRNLISSLEDTKSLIDFEDEIISVHIVGSDLTEPINSVVTSPSVTVANPTNDSERLDNLEAIMTQLLVNNRNMYDTLLRLENDGIKTI